MPSPQEPQQQAPMELSSTSATGVVSQQPDDEKHVASLPPMAGWNSLIQDPNPKPIAPLPPIPEEDPRMRPDGRIRVESPKRITGKSPVDMDIDENWRHWRRSPPEMEPGPMPPIDHRKPQAPLQQGELTPRQRHRIALRKEQQWREMLRKEVEKKDKADRERREALRQRQETIRRARAYQEKLMQEARQAREHQEKQAQGRDPDAEPRGARSMPPPRVRFEEFPPFEDAEDPKRFSPSRYTHFPGPGESAAHMPSPSPEPMQTAIEHAYGLPSSGTDVQDFAPNLPSPPPPRLFLVPGEGASMSAPASRIKHAYDDEENRSMPPYSLRASEEDVSKSMPTMSIGPVKYLKDGEEPPSPVPSLSAGGSSSHYSTDFDAIKNEVKEGDVAVRFINDDEEPPSRNSPDSDAIKSEEKEEKEEEAEVKDKGKGKAKDQSVHYAPTVESVSDEELPGRMRGKRGKPKVVPFYLGRPGSIETGMRKGG
ncbi:hypothetical protein F4679DRAFT_588136 [Xylaria curta]|nr:hypothetical protein F4679DRAFT_588136 [Xylaria curta]